MNRVLFLCIAALAFASTAGLAACVELFADGRKIEATPGVLVESGVSYGPLRAVGEALGAKIDWDAERRLAAVCRGDRCVRIKASEGLIRESRLLLPIRRLGEALGAQVDWTGGAHPRIDITSPPVS